jgi:hypothetical protein
LFIANNTGLGSDSGGAVIVNSGGKLDFLGVNVGTKAITLNGGTLTDLTSSLASPITLTASSILSAGATNILMLNGVISDGGNGFGILVSGGGSVGFSNVNTYTGPTIIDAGNLILIGAGSIASSSGLINNGSFDISGTNSGALVNSYSGNGTITLGNQVLTNASAPITQVSTTTTTTTTTTATNILAQVTVTTKVSTEAPTAAPVAGTATVSNSTDFGATKVVSTTPVSTTTTTTTSATTPTTTTTATSAPEPTLAATSVAAVAQVVTEFQASPVSLASTSPVNTQAPVNAPTSVATTSSGPTVSAVPPASQKPPPAPPVIVSKPIPKDSADSGDRTLALVKPPTVANDSPKQIARSDVRVTTTTVAAGVAMQKVEPIKPSSTAFYNQAISGLWNAR